MADPEEGGGVVAAGLGFGEDSGFCFGWELGCARQYPQVVVGAASYEGVLIVGIDEHDAIVGVKWPPERNAEQCGRVGAFGHAFCFTGFSVFYSGVAHLYFSVFAESVRRFSAVHASLEAMVKAGNLKPTA